MGDKLKSNVSNFPGNDGEPFKGYNGGPVPYDPSPETAAAEALVRKDLELNEARFLPGYKPPANE